MAGAARVEREKEKRETRVLVESIVMAWLSCDLGGDVGVDIALDGRWEVITGGLFDVLIYTISGLVDGCSG